MGEIPEELMAVASDVYDGTKDFTRFAKIHHIAEALLAERKRCAEVAMRHAEECEWTDGVIEANKIAGAILNP